MLDMIIYIGLILTAFFLFIGIANKRPLGYFIGAVFSILISIGLFTTGWQTYSSPTFNIVTNGATTVVTPSPLTILADASGTMEQRTIFFVATFCVICTLLFVFGGYKERQNNLLVQG